MLYESAAGLEIPAIGLGTMRLHGEQCRQAVSHALSIGYRHLDTARNYGNEEDVGAGIRVSGVPRGEVLLVTKLWHTELDADGVAAGVASSLERLGTDYVDVLLVHWPSRETPLAETMEALALARDKGQTRFIGVANFPAAMFEEVAELPGLIGNQVEYHPYLAQDRLLGIARAHGLVLTAYCPVGRGGELLEDPVVTQMAADHGRTVAQILLRWLVQQPGVVAIPRAGDLAHVEENVAVFDFDLSDEEMDAISGLARGGRIVDPPHAPTWD